MRYSGGAAEGAGGGAGAVCECWGQAGRGGSLMSINPVINKNTSQERDDVEINPAIGAWFKKYRESYEWPHRTGRKESEKIIQTLNSSVQLAISQRQEKVIAASLVDIHRWKTNNRSGITTEYQKSLNSKKAEYFIEIFNLSPFDTNEKLGILIGKLKIPNCNLPVCSAMASYIYNRKNVPILDRFVAQFFLKDFDVGDVDEDIKLVLQYVKKIPFKLEDGGNGNIRLSVYTSFGFEENLNKYIKIFVPECNRIAQDLYKSKIKYCDIQGNLNDFFPVDVEMAVFSYAMKHSDLF